MRRIADNKLNFQTAANDGRVEKLALTQSDVMMLHDSLQFAAVLEESREAAREQGKKHYVILEIDPV